MMSPTVKSLYRMHVLFDFPFESTIAYAAIQFRSSKAGRGGGYGNWLPVFGMVRTILGVYAPLICGSFQIPL